MCAVVPATGSALQFAFPLHLDSALAALLVLVVPLRLVLRSRCVCAIVGIVVQDSSTTRPGQLRLTRSANADKKDIQVVLGGLVLSSVS